MNEVPGVMQLESKGESGTASPLRRIASSFCSFVEGGGGEEGDLKMNLGAEV